MHQLITKLQSFGVTLWDDTFLLNNTQQQNLISVREKMKYHFFKMSKHVSVYLPEWVIQMGGAHVASVS